MNTHTLSENSPVKPSIAVQDRTTAINGIGVDCAGYDGCLVIFHLIAHLRDDSDEVLDVKIQESSDDGSSDNYADITGAAFAQIGNVVPAATKGNVYLMDIKLSKREQYLRAVGTPDGTTPEDSYTVSFLLYRGTQAPVTQDAAVVKV